jgi:hypothetical protein
LAAKTLLECSFLIPTRRDTNLSDGRPHSKHAWKWLQDQLYAFGGGTRARDLYEGWYIDPDTGERVEDLSRRYFVALARRDVARLRAVLQQACSMFAQKAIYLSIAGQVEFVEGQADEKQ